MRACLKLDREHPENPKREITANMENGIIGKRNRDEQRSILKVWSLGQKHQQHMEIC